MNLDLRSQNAQRTRSAIRTAAIDLALEHGYADMTVDDVARRAGVSRRTVFNYFPTKADLVVGSMPSPSDEAIERFVSGQGNLLHDLRDLLADAVVNVPESERYVAKMPVLLRDNPELNPVMHERVRIFADRIRSFAAQRLRLEESDPRVHALVDLADMVNRSALNLWIRAEEKGCSGCGRAAAIVAVTDGLEELFAFDDAPRSADDAPRSADDAPRSAVPGRQGQASREGEKDWLGADPPERWPRHIEWCKHAEHSEHAAHSEHAVQSEHAVHDEHGAHGKHSARKDHIAHDEPKKRSTHSAHNGHSVPDGQNTHITHKQENHA